MTQPPRQPPPVVIPSSSGNNIIMNPLQRGNPILDHIRNIGKEYGDIVVDYQVGKTTGVLFLSLKYHRLHPEYISTRIDKLGISYNLRILLILSDISEHRDAIRELTKLCLINNITILVAFSAEEAGHYLATLKQFEHKPPDLIKERADKDYTSMLRTSLTSIGKINKTDAETLRTSFRSFANIAKADSARLQNLPGFGQVKVKNIKNAFEKPFRNNATNTLASLIATQNNSNHDSSANAQPLVSSKSTERAVVKPHPARSPSPVWDIELDATGEQSPSWADHLDAI